MVSSGHSSKKKAYGSAKIGLVDLSSTDIPSIQNRHQGSSSLMGQSSQNLVKLDESVANTDCLHNIGGVVISAVKNKIIINDDLSSHHQQQLLLGGETSAKIKKDKEISSFTVNKLNLDSPNEDLKLPFQCISEPPSQVVANRDLIIVSMLSASGNSAELVDTKIDKHDNLIAQPFKIQKQLTNKLEKSKSQGSEIGDIELSSNLDPDDKKISSGIFESKQKF
jgi:hypothetical protein